MNKTSLFLLVILLLMNIFSLFWVKYHVVKVKTQLQKVQREISKDLEIIHVLQAEWTYLNQPQRLQYLARKYLNMQNITVAQIRRDLLPKNSTTKVVLANKANSLYYLHK